MALDFIQMSVVAKSNDLVTDDVDSIEEVFKYIYKFDIQLHEIVGYLMVDFGMSRQDAQAYVKAYTEVQDIMAV